MQLRASLLVVTVVLAASSALAGTPLPDPPFSGGGFVAPSKDVLKQEEKVNTLLARYAHKRSTCDRVAVNDLQLAYTPINATKVAAVQARWTVCVQKVDAYFIKNRDYLLGKGTPACLDQSGIDILRGATDTMLASVASDAYCDDDGAAPDPVTGLNIPDKKQESIGEREVAKLAVRAGQHTAKCYSKAAYYALRNGGTLSPDLVIKINDCLTRVTQKAQDAIADLDQQQKLPDCLPPAAAEAAVGTATGFASILTAAIYCASPSGAFVDGPPLL